MALKKLGEILLDLGLVEDDQLEKMLAEQQSHEGRLLGQIGVKLEYFSEEQLGEALAEQWSTEFVSLEGRKTPHDVLQLVSNTMAQLYRIVPISLDGDTLTIASYEPQKFHIADELKVLLGLNIHVVVATQADIMEAIRKHYEEEDSILGLIEQADTDTDLKAAATAAAAIGDDKIDIAGAEALADSGPVRKLLNTVLLMAVKENASDIHFEPFQDKFRIRIKADGVLQEIPDPSPHLAFPITTRIKVLSNLDIAERRLPQDGRIELLSGGNPVEFRVSVLPTLFGESVVMRVLDRSVVSLNLEKLGMAPDILAKFREMIHRPNGIILVTGPTGSGKTTTLYSALSELNDIEEKLITTEDPVEYDIDGIVQVPIDFDIGITFAAALRSILRQDPDRILVGEIRDTETAEIAVQAALTGHMVFSTLHTNDAPATVTRLRDMGVPPFLITATVEAIMAQRLVRRICGNCKEQIQPDADMLADLELTSEEIAGKKFFRGRGCNACKGTGYKGRLGLYEFLVMNDELRGLVARNASTEEIREVARKHGMITLRDSGIQNMFLGNTTADEVIRETILEV